MPNKNYIRGYQFQRRGDKLLEKKGFVVIAHGKSRFPDSVAVGKHLTMFIEYKGAREFGNPVKLLSQEEYDKALELISKTDKPFVLFHRNKNFPRKLAYTVIGGLGIKEVGEALG